MCAIPQTSPPGMKLEDRDDGVYHCLEASSRKMIMKTTTYKCTIISTRQKTPTTSSKQDSLNSRRQCVWHDHVCTFYGVVGQLLRCRPHRYARNRWCPPCFLVCIGAVSCGQTEHHRSELSVLAWEADYAPQHSAKFHHHRCGAVVILMWISALHVCMCMYVYIYSSDMDIQKLYSDNENNYIFC